VEEFVNFDKKGGNLIKEPLVLDVKLINRTIVLEPSLSEAKSYWYGELHKQVEIICGLERLDIKIEENQDNYRNLLLQMSDKFNIKKAYMTMQKVFGDAEEYLSTWKSYQALWDIDQTSIYSRLKEDIDMWNQLLGEIRAGRKTFDTQDSF
jgi:uncharacterized protein YutE (UPF0331/DUF86 family)